ncbi:signal recognition particle-docking protein FtsY [Candidatus Erwinia dacicola]|uniref:Signal recognition particle receptor FtsY n=1 Tax=Candidatus Erwinia dacicola TaxID=252393 RepID=A0A1E7Z4L2_9GAMM|nr:signal recognition particle-docking protein FtsY [Candidatus Erwinia dacicola]NJD85489.1 signal recognition particle-docking protein FtsY [Candidatus Erwinia dacicola]OFC63676.1 signal recognition particle-docking protein FtsY [Candidatus Erwinia dacicola]RAP71488.1 signal recognition particle-docking protein FtsY [Candidatus Erwinia dacicola]
MAKNKKRRFFPWLGLGRDEKTPEVEKTLEQQPTADIPVAEETPAVEDALAAEATPASDAPSPLIGEPELAPRKMAEEIVAVTESVAEQQAEEARVVEVPIVAEPELVVVTPEPEVISAVEEEILPEEIAAEEEVIDDASLEAGVLAAEPVDAALTAEIIEESAEEPAEPEEVAAAVVEQERLGKEGFFARLKQSLVKTRQNLGSGFIRLFRGKKIDNDLFEELEEQLLIADVGLETTRRIISNLTTQASRKELRDAEALYGLLKTDMAAILSKVEESLDVSGKTPFVILMVGVNGVGKTTTIGKLARQFQAEGKSVMLAAGDTFRAAAVEQLQVWGQRNNIPVVAQHTGADCASVIFDAIQAAKARQVDVLIADTAGRLQNKAHLMEELKKITRVMKKLDDQAPHEVMLTIDASTGQNTISQTKRFHEAVGLTGITLTKLDGTAKCGVIFSVADQFNIPIRYIGVGEGIEDLRSFKADDFIEALFARED